MAPKVVFKGVVDYFTNILWVSIGFKLIRNIDDASFYNTSGPHAAELRGGTFRRALEAV